MRGPEQAPGGVTAAPARGGAERHKRHAFRRRRSMKEWSGTTLDASGGRRAFALTKLVARRRGVNPVWYVDMTSGHDWVISPALNQLRDWTANWAATESKPFASYPTARLFPFFETMGTWPGRNPKEFWWEREWRRSEER